ncbi:hypothetical protein [Paraburkholderia phenoliruptrix]|nr:hypothetical protein [Paraburkholderia phenoliruptrix]
MNNPAKPIDPLHDVDLKERRFNKTTATDVRNALPAGQVRAQI